MTTYIYQHPNWPNFTWDNQRITSQLAEVKNKKGLLLGKMFSLGFNLQNEAILDITSEEVIKSAAIENEILNSDEVRSSVARRLNYAQPSQITSSQNVEGIVSMMMDALCNYQDPLTLNRLLGWQAALFPTGYSGLRQIKTGELRDDSLGPMQVVSGPENRETVHFQAPPASQLPSELTQFINWLNNDDSDLDQILKAAIAHLWFLTIHPFDDGNGRLARAISDLLLARSDQTSKRFYSLSQQIQKTKKAYYLIIEKTQKGSLEITEWLSWFLTTLLNSIAASDLTLKRIFDKHFFLQKTHDFSLNHRQYKIIDLLFNDFQGYLTSSKWAKLTKSSQDTANRDIAELLEFGLLKKIGAGRSTRYELNL